MSFIVAIDSGTSSSRCLIINAIGQVIASAQAEHRQFFPHPGWVEHDATEIWHRSCQVTELALDRAGLRASDIAAIGITNQRETVVVWDRRTGEPITHAIVWQDTRTQEIVDRLGENGGTERFRERTGLPLATYFAGPKITWILDHVPGARARAAAGDLLAGTIDSWLIYKLTDAHLTDVTNASRTLLMDLRTLCWDADIAAEMGIELSLLPEIRSSSQDYGPVRAGHLLAGVPIAGVLGDQQAATVGQACLRPGEAKNTYGTGNFMLLNTGNQLVHSSHGLLTTVCYQFGAQPPVYALEGSIAVTGSLVQWLRDNLGLISRAAEIQDLARSVDDCGGVYFVPAFSGLFAPYWRPDARGVIVGLTRYITKGHIARAALEATAFQTREVCDAMAADSGITMTTLKVDGGMVGNDLLMQFQADILGTPVIRPTVTETTALGAAYAAGLAVGFWSSEQAIRDNWSPGASWQPQLDPAAREQRYATWRKAVTRTFDWA